MVVGIAWGVIVGSAVLFSYFKWKKKRDVMRKLVPKLALNQFGKLKDLESFGDYVGKLLTQVN